MLQALRRWLLRPPSAAPVELAGRRIIVTGCAPGSIGYETARILATFGAEVVITTRAGTEAVVRQLGAAGQVRGHALDLCDARSVEAFAAWYRATLGERLDVLINNAGVHLDLLSQWQEPRLIDGHEIHWRTNCLGTLHLTLRLLPLLLRTAATQGEARIVTVVSELHRKGSNADLPALTRPYNSWHAYGNSKLALVHATFELQRRYGDSHGLRALCLHPGAVFTNIADKGLSGNPLLERSRKVLAPIERLFLLTPQEGAQTSVHCATSPAADGGQYYRNCRPLAAAEDSRETSVASRLLLQAEEFMLNAAQPPLADA